MIKLGVLTEWATFSLPAGKLSQSFSLKEITLRGQEASGHVYDLVDTSRAFPFGEFSDPKTMHWTELQWGALEWTGHISLCLEFHFTRLHMGISKRVTTDLSFPTESAPKIIFTLPLALPFDLPIWFQWTHRLPNVAQEPAGR